MRDEMDEQRVNTITKQITGIADPIEIDAASDTVTNSSGIYFKRPLITVIIPAFNAVHCLERCVLSVLRQTMKNIEVIVVDDGSIDGTDALADDFAAMDGRVRVIHQTNTGLSGARNTGIDNATGEYLYFIDADDYIEPNVLATLHVAIEETDARMAVGGLVKVDQDGNFISRSLVQPIMVGERDYWLGFESARGTINHLEYTVSWGKLFDSGLFSNLRFALGKIHEDEFIIHSLVAEAETVVFADTDGYRYVQSPGSIMHKLKASDCLDAAEAFLDREAYFESRNWFDLAFTAIYMTRREFAFAIKMDKNSLDTMRSRELRARWRSALFRVMKEVPGDYIRKGACLLFNFSPSIYLILTGR